jgi:alpha-glucoside transport system substrate-binding protein
MKSSRSLHLVISLVSAFLILSLLSLTAQSVVRARVVSVTDEVINVAGSASLSAYQPLFDDFASRTGHSIVYTRISVPDDLKYCQDEACPDVAFSPWPGLVKEMCASNDLIDLNTVVNPTVLNANYTADWIAFGTVGTRLCGVPFSANNKSLVWYDPQEFSGQGWATPTTWTEMLALSDQIVSSGTPPWSIGLESGLASGWPATDWFEDIFLHKYGGDLYDDLTVHAISWTSPEVVAAFNDFAQIFGNESYQLGGKTGTLNTFFIDAIYPPFNSPPGAYLHRQGSFARGFIQNEFPSQVPGVDYAIFSFPNMNPAVQNAHLGAGDLAMMLEDSPEARDFINYIITTDAANVWVAGGGVSPNKNVDFDLYPDPNTRQAAEWLANAATFRFDLSDLMPAELNTFFWSALLDLVVAAPDQGDMLVVLQQIEDKASEFQQIIPTDQPVQFQYTSPDGYLTTIDIPVGTFSQEVLLQHIPLDAVGTTPIILAYAGRGLSLLAFLDNEPIPVPVLNHPIQVTMTYPDPAASGIFEDTISPYYWDGSYWRTDGITVIERDPDNNRIVFNLTHLTDFALFGEDHIYQFLPLITR